MLSKDEVKNIAALARIGLGEKDIEKYQRDLSRILDYFEKLRELNTENIEPANHITGLENVTRVDQFSVFRNIEGIKKLFPEEKDGYDKVKSVL
jgi:aspartyl-tRNA(Asn)/glutamyl-tRNA(Gln) amidotransferase subunit C